MRGVAHRLGHMVMLAEALELASDESLPVPSMRLNVIHLSGSLMTARHLTPRMPPELVGASASPLRGAVHPRPGIAGAMRTQTRKVLGVMLPGVSLAVLVRREHRAAGVPARFQRLSGHIHYPPKQKKLPKPAF